jgi:hypothetical protein
MGEMLRGCRLCQNARPATTNTETISISEVKGWEDGKGLKTNTQLRDATSTLIYFDSLLRLGLENYLSSMAVPKKATHAEKDPNNPERY